MNPNELEELLGRIRDGVASEADFDRAQTLLGEEEAACSLDVAGAIFDEAGGGGSLGEFDFSQKIMAGIGVQEPELPIAEAVREAAGKIDIADDVLAEVSGKQWSPEWLSALLDHELTEESHRGAVRRLVREPGAGSEMTAFAEIGRHIRESVRVESGGEVDLWSSVARGMGMADPEAVHGWDGQRFAAAVRVEAGSVDVVDAVMARVRRSSQGASPVIPEPANRGFSGSFSWGAVAAAAVFGIVLTASRSFWAPDLGADPSLSARGIPQGVIASLHFAHSDEIRLEFPTESQAWVEVPEKDEDPLIIWVEEEASL